jgi:hypothetical protein
MAIVTHRQGFPTECRHDFRPEGLAGLVKPVEVRKFADMVHLKVNTPSPAQFALPPEQSCQDFTLATTDPLHIADFGPRIPF